MSLLGASSHIAGRPDWTCRAGCGPWPCRPARAELLLAMDAVQLGMYLWGKLEEAADDLPDLPVGEAFERFRTWARPMNPDPVRNHELVAERLGWPDGALEACQQLAVDHPQWLVFWTRGQVPLEPRPGFRASLRVRGHLGEAWAATAGELHEQLVTYDAELPPPPEFPAPFTPLV